jgi:FkbM family methyltransferase
MDFKEAIRNILIYLHLDITKNLAYDRLTKKIMHQFIKPNSNCIDIGCHKGEILNTILQLAPNGKHFGFEPIPYLFKALVSKYKNQATILPFALANETGETTFNLVKNDPAYSGLQKRRYDFKNPDIEIIKVELQKLDNVIPKELPIDFIKIDVEGGEFGVLQGAKETIKRCKPLIIFESGTGASDYYNTNAADIFSLISTELNMHIYTLQGFIKKNNPLSMEQFSNYFDTASEYYYVAYPKK